MLLDRYDDSPKVQFNLRISEEANLRLRADAEAHGLSLGAYLEMLILERGVTHTDYYAQQAAIQSFVAAGLLVSVVARQIGPEKAKEIQRQAAEAAAGLFGQVRQRPPAIGDTPPEDDPRILGLFQAFGAA